MIRKKLKPDLVFFGLEDEHAMGVLQEIGPDTLIPCFSVNIRGNNDVNLCNAVNTAIFNDLCHDSAEESEQRMPMIVTSSTMKDHQYSSALEHFKKRLGVRKVKYSQTSTTATLGNEFTGHFRD